MATKPTEAAGRSEPNYPIASVDNALRLLLLFRAQPSVRLSEAGEFLGVAHSTAHRLLAMLAFHGFVSQDPDSRAYIPGPALMEVGLAIVRNIDIRAQARPHMEALVERFDETVHLARLDGNDIHYLDAVESSKTVRVVGRTGKLLPAHCTATGKSLLARLDEQTLRSIYPVDVPMAAATARSIATFEDLTKELDEVRRLGYAANDEESEDGAGSVAMAIVDPLGKSVASLGISAPVFRIRGPRWVEMTDGLREAVAAIEKSLP